MHRQICHIVDHVVADTGLTANAELYDALAPRSTNAGAVDQAGMINGAATFPKVQDGDFALARIGDAVAGRNIHAALYDAIRIAMGDF